MMTVRQTLEFERWLTGLRDRRAYAKVILKVERMANGNLGDVKPTRSGVSETRINYGPGYRIYFCQQGDEVIILLAGGDKSSQQEDIAKAIKLKNAL